MHPDAGGVFSSAHLRRPDGNGAGPPLDHCRRRRLLSMYIRVCVRTRNVKWSTCRAMPHECFTRPTIKIGTRASSFSLGQSEFQFNSLCIMQQFGSRMKIRLLQKNILSRRPYLWINHIMLFNQYFNVIWTLPVCFLLIL
jgi:hypothetical protein